MAMSYTKIIVSITQIAHKQKILHNPELLQVMLHVPIQLSSFVHTGKIIQEYLWDILIDARFIICL